MTTKIKILYTAALILAVVIPFFGIRTVRAIDIVPYTSQAPLGQWNDPRQKDGCEEASVIMAMMWAQNLNFSREEIRQQIIGMSDYEQFFFGYYQDSSAGDTAKLITQYFGYGGATALYNISTDDIKATLDSGQLVIVPINPRVISTKLYNRSTLKHMVVVVGYDAARGEIIFHDPLVGAYRHASESVFNKALADYPSGRNITSKNRTSAMIVVSKEQPKN